MSKKLVLTLSLLLLIAAAVVFATVNFLKTDSDVVAVVNGAKITADEVEEEYRSLPPELRIITPKSDALEFVIERKILVQQAKREGLSYADEELEEFYRNYPNLQNVGNGSSLDSLMRKLEDQLLINKLLDKHVPNSFVIKHDEAQRFYAASSFPGQNRSFDEVEGLILNMLTEQRLREARQQYINTLKRQAKVTIKRTPP